MGCSKSMPGFATNPTQIHTGRELERMLSNKMVATRRGTRVGSPTTRPEEETPEPTIRRTRRRTVIVTDPSQTEHTSDSQQDEAEEQNKVPAEPGSPPKRETRGSKRQKTTANQTDCVHEADVSESESCCSVASDVLVQSTTRSRRRTAGRERPKAAAGQEVSEEESCSSAPASKPRRSTRSQKKSASVPTESTTSQDNNQSEAESCSSVVSLSKVVETRMITRSRRRIAVLPEDADPSEADSCSSAVSPQQSTVRRSMRNRGTKPTKPIPIHLDESEAEASASSASTKTKDSNATSFKEDPVYDSEGCRSGPSTSPRRTAHGVIAADSDSESTCISLDSPRSLRVRLTPCSSRTGSASSSRTVPSSRTRSQVKVTENLSNVPSVASMGEKLDCKEGELEKGQTEIPMDTTSQSVSAAASDREDNEEMNEEEINKTVICVNDQECSILEEVNEDLTLTLDEDDVSSASAEANMLAKESKQDTSSVRDVSMCDTTENTEENSSTEEQAETEKGVKLIEECEMIPEPAMESKAEFMQEAHGLDDQASAVVKKPEKGVRVTEEDEPNVMDKHDTEDHKRSDSAETEKSVKVVDESEEKAEAMEELVADDVTTEIENQKPLELQEMGVRVTEEAGKSEAEKVQNMAEDVSVSQTISVIYSDADGRTVEDEQDMAVEEHGDIHAGHHESVQQNKVEDGSQVQTAEEGPSCSSNIETKSDKGMGCLLDSSEDEESDGEGLSDEGCREDAGECMESENEAMCSTEVQPGTSGEPDSAHNHGLFVIDTRPGLQPSEKYYIDSSRKEEHSVDDSKAVEAEEEFVDEEGDDEDEDEDSKALFTTRKPALTSLSSAIDPGLKVKELGGLYISFDGSKPKSVSNNLKRLKDQKNQDELLKNSVIVADFEKKDAVPPYRESKHAAKLKRKEEKAKTTGDGWFNMKAPELTEEMKNDLKALKMRSAMDPKRFYKKNDREGFPKYFQVGTVVDNPADFYHSRIPKKERKRTIVEELMADAEFRSFNKRKYQEIMSERAAEAAGKMNKKHKFHKKK